MHTHTLMSEDLTKLNSRYSEGRNRCEGAFEFKNIQTRHCCQ